MVLLLKYFQKRRKCCQPAFSPFSTMFPILSKTKTIIGTKFILLSANTFHLVMAKILLSGKELNNWSVYWLDFN